MSRTFPRGTVLRSRYRIAQLLHQSRLANVYLVEDQHIQGRVWAVKELPLVAVDAHERQRVVQRFTRDATVLASLSHPNLSKVVDYFAEGSCLYLVREYVHGTDLRAYLASRVLPIVDREAISAGLQVIDALMYLQSKRFPAIFYREFHSGNVVMCPDNQVKVIDLGLAQLFQAAADEDAQRIGSLEYSAPEQFAEDGTFDGRSLVYATGALLYHMLTRRNPSLSPFDLMPIAELNSAVSRGLAETVQRATQVDPRNRYPTLGDLRRRLQLLMRDLEMSRSRGRGSSGSGINLSKVVMNGVLAFFFVALVGGVLLLAYYLSPR